MKLVNKIMVISTVLAILLSLNGTSAQAQAGAKCPKAGQTRTIKGVSYICTAKASVKKGAKATAVWVASTPTTSTTIPEKDTYGVAYLCGETFVNSRYPQLELDKLPVKPSSQSLFISGKTSGCYWGVSWTPSNKPEVNSLRNVSICFKDFKTWPVNTITVSCDSAIYLKADGSASSTLVTSSDGFPFFGFRLVSISGYLGDTTTPVWKSAEHLVMFDFDCQGSCSYVLLNSIQKV